MSQRKKSPFERIWDATGRIFKGKKKDEMPEGMDFCDMCGKMYRKEDFHRIIEFFGTKEDLILCEECIELSPTEWRRNRSELRKKHSVY